MPHVSFRMFSLAVLASLTSVGCQALEAPSIDRSRIIRTAQASVSADGEISFSQFGAKDSSARHGKQFVEVTADAHVDEFGEVATNTTVDLQPTFDAFLTPAKGAMFFEDEGHAYLNWFAQQPQKTNKAMEFRVRRNITAEKESDTFQADDGTIIHMPRLLEVPTDEWDAFRHHVKTTPHLALLLQNISAHPSMMRRLLLAGTAFDRDNHSGADDWNPFESITKIVDKVREHPLVKTALDHPIAKAITKRLGGAVQKVGLLLNLKPAFDSIKELVDCFEGVDDEKYHMDHLLKWMGDRKGKPLGSLMNDFTTTFISPAVDQLVQAVSDRKANSSKFAEMFKDARGEFTKEKATKLLDMAYGLLEEFARLPAWEPFGCVEDHMIQPGWEKVKPVFVDLLVEIGKKYQSMWDSQVMMVVKFAAARISNVVKLSKNVLGTSLMSVQRRSEWSVKGVTDYAYNAVNKLCRDKSNQMNELLTVFTQTVMQNTGGDGTVTYENAYTKVTESLLKQAKTIATEALVKWMNDMVVMVTDKIISPALQAARELLLTMLANAKSTMIGLCGIIPVAGAAVCSLITSAMTTAENAVSSALGDQTKTIILDVLASITAKALDMVNFAFDKIQSTVTTGVNAAMKTVDKIADAFKPVVDAIMPVAESFIPVLKGKLTECDASFVAIGGLMKAINDVRPARAGSSGSGGGGGGGGSAYGGGSAAANAQDSSAPGAANPHYNWHQGSEQPVRPPAADQKAADDKSDCFNDGGKDPCDITKK